MSAPDTPTPPERRSRRLPRALLLQCLPLLAAASCLTRGALGEDAQQALFLDVRYLVVLSACAWGIGYLVLRRWRRWLLAFLAGVIGSVVAANAALGGWSLAAEGQGEASLRQAALVWGTLVIVGVAVLLLDTWQLAARERPAAGEVEPSRPGAVGP
jgi:hypothetical protein